MKSSASVLKLSSKGFHSAILDDWLLMWGIDAIFSVHYRPDGPLYEQSRHTASIYPCLPGYVDLLLALLLGLTYLLGGLLERLRIPVILGALLVAMGAHYTPLGNLMTGPEIGPVFSFAEARPSR